MLTRLGRSLRAGRAGAAAEPVRRHAAAVALLATLTGLVLHPAVRHFTSRPMVGGNDSSIFAWAWWNLEQSLRQGRTPFHSDLLYFPVGVDLSVTVVAPAIGLLSWPVRVLFGPAAQMNAVQLGAVLASAVSLYLLALRSCRRRSVAAIAGAAFAFTPYLYAHIGEHLNLIHTWVLPLAFVLALRLIDEPTPRRSAALGAAIGFAVLVEPQLAVIAALGAGSLLVRRWDRPRPTAAIVMTCVGVACAVAAPVAIPMAVGLLGGASSTPLTAHQLQFYSSRVSSWVLPAPWHPWFGHLTNTGSFHTPIEGVASPGLVVLVLAYLGRRHVGRSARRGWVAMAWIGMVFSLGPYLVLGEEGTSVPLPYYPVRLLPFMDTMRAPGRFAVLGVLALCILAAQAADALLDRRRRSGSWVPVAAVSVLLAIELLPAPLVSIDGDAPAPYEAIADDPGEGAVLEVPVQWLTGSDALGYAEDNLTIFQAWATVHGKPYVGGSVSRYPDDSLAELAAIPLYRQLLALQGDDDFNDDVEFDAADLADLGIGYVVYHRDIPFQRARTYFEDLDLPVLADDGTVVVWKVPTG